MKLRYYLVSFLLAFLAVSAFYFFYSVYSDSNISFSPISVSNKCNDSDGGLNLIVAGTAKNSQTGFSDYCVFSSNKNGVIYEATCSGKTPKIAKATCPKDFPYCNKGACSKIAPVCTDSDNGKDFYSRGEIAIPQDNSGLTHFDYCENLKTKNPYKNCSGKDCGLREYYCNGLNLGYKDTNCSDGCENGECKNKNTASEYTCSGKVINGLCYGNKSYLLADKQNYYEDEKVKIYGSNYSSKISVGDEVRFTLHIENKLASEYNLDLSFEVPSAYFEIINSQLSNEYRVKHQIMKLAKMSYNEYAITLKATNENLFNGNSFLNLGITNSSGTYFVDFPISVEAISDFTLCSGIKFPNSYHDPSVMMYNSFANDYSSSKCCNNVFYPSFECCSNKDCASGSCIDGFCINRIFQGNGAVKDLAKGNKKVLVIMTSNSEKTDNFPCLNKAENYANMTNEVESFYDFSANKYLNESSNFIDFNWTFIGNFNVNGLEDLEMFNYSLNQCGLNQHSFDEIILYNPERVDFCGIAPACAGKPILTEVLYNSGTISHELAHNFGCRDLYMIGGGNLQWGTSLMSTSEGADSVLLPTLDVCRGEMGWADLDKNGIIDVKEFVQPREIKLNYTGIHFEDRPKGRYLIFDNLTVLGLINNSWKPFLNAQKSIEIQRNNVTEYMCGGSETCAPVLEGDLLVLTAKYSYTDISLGKIIEFSADEIRVPISNFSF